MPLRPFRDDVDDVMPLAREFARPVERDERLVGAALPVKDG
jgi:hypothetical protein